MVRPLSSMTEHNCLFLRLKQALRVFIGNSYDSYAVTDTMISGKGPSLNDPHGHLGGKSGGERQHQSGGPLLDFKTAFSAGMPPPPDHESGKVGEFLHDPTLSGHMSQEDIHRTLQANLPTHPLHHNSSLHHGAQHHHHNNNHLHHAGQQHHHSKSNS